MVSGLFRLFFVLEAAFPTVGLGSGMGVNSSSSTVGKRGFSCPFPPNYQSYLGVIV